MKTLLTAFVIMISFSCSENKKESALPTEAEKMDRILKRIERELSSDKEKIILLSSIRKIPFDTLNSILRDYFIFTYDLYNSDSTAQFKYEKIIDDLSSTYTISKSQIATLIFSFKYEMLTSEDIEERVFEHLDIGSYEGP